jgi:hypothetical protein
MLCLCAARTRVRWHAGCLWNLDSLFYAIAQALCLAPHIQLPHGLGSSSGVSTGVSVTHLAPTQLGQRLISGL